MTHKPTRLEVVIVVVALLLLAFISREPRSGRAYVHVDGDQAERSAVPADAGQNPDEAAASRYARSDGNMEATTPATKPPKQPYKVQRMARVDARGVAHLGYPEVMYGEITVRWIWNGHKLVPCKVVEVTERDGTVTVWSFDDQDNVTITELPPEYVPAD